VSETWLELLGALFGAYLIWTFFRDLRRHVADGRSSLNPDVDQRKYPVRYWTQMTVNGLTALAIFLGSLYFLVKDFQ
jgi:hypothetical protein